MKIEQSLILNVLSIEAVTWQRIKDKHDFFKAVGPKVNAGPGCEMCSEHSRIVLTSQAVSTIIVN